MISVGLKCLHVVCILRCILGQTKIHCNVNIISKVSGHFPLSYYPSPRTSPKQRPFSAQHLDIGFLKPLLFRNLPKPCLMESASICVSNFRRKGLAQFCVFLSDHWINSQKLPKQHHSCFQSMHW